MARVKTKVCLACGESLRGRRDTKTCSARCRKRLHRAKILLQQEVDQARQATQTVAKDLGSAIGPSFATEGGFIGEATATPVATMPIRTPAPTPATTSTPAPAVPPTASLTTAPQVSIPAPTPVSQPTPAIVMPPTPASIEPVAELEPIPVVQAPPVGPTMAREALPELSVGASPASSASRTPQPVTLGAEQITHIPGAVVAPTQVPAARTMAPVAGAARSTSLYDASSLENSETTQSSTPAPNSFITQFTAAPQSDSPATPKHHVAPALNDSFAPAAPPGLFARSLKPLAAGLAAFLLISGAAMLLFGHQALIPVKQATNIDAAHIFSSDTGAGSLSINLDTTIGRGAKLTATGPVLFKNQANSNQAFAVQDASGTSLISVNTNTGTVFINGLQGSGAALTNINASNLTSGSVANARLSSQVTQAGNVFNGANQLVILDSAGNLPPLDASALFGLNASNISIGTLTDARLSPNVALLNANNNFSGNNGFTGVNTFSNSNNSFSGDGTGLINLNASNITVGTLADARLSSNVALLNANNTFSGSNTFNAMTIQTGNFLFQSATNAVGAFQVQNAAGNDNLIVADTINTRLGIGVASPNYTLDVNGDINIANGQAYRINGAIVCDNTGCIPSSGSNVYVQLQASTPGTQQIGNLNINGTAIANNFSGSGINLTNLDASQVALGTLNDLRLSPNVTLQGNDFNGASQLVQTTALGYLPALNGSNLTNLNATNLATGTVSDSRLSVNVALLGASSQTFTGSNVFTNIVTAPGLETTNNGHAISIGFAGTATGAMNYNFDVAAAPGTYTICTSIGNCSGAGSGVTAPTPGTTNKLAKFTGGQTIGDSIITDSGSTITIAGNLAANAITQSGNTVCDVSGNCAGVGGQVGTFGSPSAGTIALFHGSSTIENSILTQAVGTVTAGGNFNVTGNYQVGGVQISSAALSNDSNLAKLNANQTFTGNNTFTGSVLIQPAADATNIAVIEKSVSGGGTAVLVADTSNTRIGIGIQPSYTLDVNGDVNISSGSSYRINGTAICGPSTTCAPSSGSNNYIQNTVALQTSANFNIESTATGSITGILKAKSGQTVDILEVKDGSGNVVSSVGNNGQTVYKDFTVGSHTFFQIQSANFVPNLLAADSITGQILLPNATLSSTALLLGGDANLYRSAASTLKTDGNFVVSGVATVAGVLNANATGKTAISIADSGAQSSGITIGTDTNLYRSAAATLKTDGALQVVGNLSTTSSISFTNTGNANQGISLSMVVTSAVNAHDVVIIDTGTAGQVTTVGASGSNKVFGVATTTNTAGIAQPIMTSGVYQVTADTNVINVGDMLVTSVTTGQVASSTSSAAGTVLGRALSAKAAGSSGLIWVYLTPGQGGGSGSGGSNSYGLMESDFVNTGAILPGPLSGSALVTIGNTIYSFGGNNASTATNKIFSAPVSNPTNWTDTGATIPVADANSGYAIIGSNIYLFGGMGTSGTALNSIYFAPVSNPLSWSTSGSTLPSGIGQSHLAVIGNTIYMFGGFTTATTNKIFSAPVSSPTSWIDTGATLPVALRFSSVAVIGNYVYLFGGASTSSVVNAVYRAPVSNPLSWATTTGTLPNQLETDAGVAIIGGYIYQFGGFNGNTSAYTNAIYRTPINNPVNGWTNTGSVIPANNTGLSPVIAGNAIYLIGGGAGTATNTIYSAPIFNGSPDVSSNPSWITDANTAAGGGGTSSQTANTSTELAYAQTTSTVTTTQTVEASATTVVTAPSITTDGNTPIMVEFWAPFIDPPPVVNGFMFLTLFDGSTPIGKSLYERDQSTVANSTDTAGIYEVRVTPSAGSHTYSIRAYVGSNTGTIGAGAGGANAYLPAYIRIILANPLQGGANGGIQNGTTTQAGNFNVQSNNANNPAGILKGASGQSADVFDVQNSSGANLLRVDPNGNVSAAGTIGFTNVGNANQGITTNFIVTSSVNANDVVAIDTNNAGQLTTTTAQGSTKVFGVATQTKVAGQSQPIVVSGVYQVTADTNAVNVGDFLISSSVAGQVVSSTSPSAGSAIGRALSAKAGGSSGLVWIQVTPGLGGGGGSTGGLQSYGLMESDFVNTGATLPGLLSNSQTATIGNTIYMFGGANASTAVNVIYSAPVSNPTNWTNTGSTIPDPLYDSQLAVIGNTIYLFGGLTTGGSISNKIYTASTSSPTVWSTSGGVLPDSIYSSQLAVIGNTIYLFGGANASTVLNKIYTAPLSSPTTWSTSANLLPAAVQYSSVAVIGNYVYLFGGNNSVGTTTSNIYRAPTSSPTVWTSTGGSLPGSLSRSQFAIVGGFIYLLGGNNGSFANVIYHAPINNPVNGWVNTNSTLPTPWGGSQVAIVGNALYLLGGNNGSASGAIYAAPVFTNSPDTTSNPSWKVAANTSSGGGTSTAGELAYNEFTSNVTITATTAGTANTVVTATTINSDGSTPVIIQFFAPYVDATEPNIAQFDLYDGSTDLGFLTVDGANGGTADVYTNINLSRRLTPSVGSHTYSIRAWKNGGGVVVNAGAGGVGANVPGYVRITTANGTGGSAGSVANGTATQTGNFNIQSAGVAFVAATIQGASGQSADLLDIRDGSGNIVFGVGPTGNTIVKPSTNSATAFQIQNFAGTSNLFIADTANTRIGIGATPGTSLLTIGTNTTTPSGGITLGTDTNLYRSAASTLMTDGAMAFKKTESGYLGGSPTITINFSGISFYNISFGAGNYTNASVAGMIDGQVVFITAEAGAGSVTFTNVQGGSYTISSGGTATLVRANSLYYVSGRN